MSSNQEINLINLLYKIARYWKLIVINFIVVSIIAVIISLLLPKWYQAEAVIMPPVKEGSFGLGLGMAGQLAGMMLGGGGDFDLPMFATPSDIYEMILKSRGVADSIIQKYNLMQLYKQQTIEETRLELTSHTFLEVGKEGAIFIRFEAKNDPVLAANVVQGYIDELDKANKRVKIFYAHNTRKFIEERLAENKEKLKAAEDSLQAFQKRYNAVSIEDQVTAAVNNYAQLLAQKQYYEVQLNAFQDNVDLSHPEVRELASKIQGINKKIREMKYGDKTGITQELMKDTDMFPPFVSVPQLGLDYARRLRDLKIQELIFELLTQQHEQEKIKEAKDTPTVVVLDKPVPPTKKSRPKRAIIVLLAALLSIFYSLFVIFIKEYNQHLRMNNPDDYDKLQAIKSEFTSIFRRRRNE
ncbi:hypothetical protein JW964_22610 [candidate division KSB1 bacterium]|nr:hypothetical protein [candidate division KSB1 bacterium]